MGRPIFLGIFAVTLIPWIMSFADPAPQQNKCGFPPASEADFRNALSDANWQRWTVWPGLSNGLFFPSNLVLLFPTQGFDEHAEQRLYRYIKQSSPDLASPHLTLMASHAVMRSLNAQFLRVSNVPDFRVDGVLVSKKVRFWYLLPQRRFAPYCLHCVAFPSTNIGITFHYDIRSETYALIGVRILYDGFKASIDHGNSERIGLCPAFPEQAVNRP